MPTSAERTGDFSSDSFTIYDPTQPEYTTGPLAGTRQPFANNIISNPNPIAVNFLSNMPKCKWQSGRAAIRPTNGQLNNFFLPGVDPTTAQRFDIRIDWNQSQKQHIFGRFSFDRLFNSTFNAFGNEWDLNYAQNVTNGRNILIADDYTLNPTTVLQLRYSFTRHYENQGGDPQQNGTDITSLGFPASLAAEQNYRLSVCHLHRLCFPGRSTSGVGGTANDNTFQYASENSDVNIALTKVVGKHSIDTGFEWLKRFLNVGQPIAPAGSYAFDYSATDQNHPGRRHPRRRQRLRLIPRRHGNRARNRVQQLPQLLQGPLCRRGQRLLRNLHSGHLEAHAGTSPLPPACAGTSSAVAPSGITALSTSIRRPQQA